MLIEKLRVFAVRVVGVSLAVGVAGFCARSLAAGPSRFGPAKAVAHLESRDDPVRQGFSIMESSQRQSFQFQESSQRQSFQFQESSQRQFEQQRERSRQQATARELAQLERELELLEREIALLLLEEQQRNHRHRPKPSPFR